MKEGGWMKKIETLNQKLVFSLDCFFKSHYICNPNCDVT